MNLTKTILPVLSLFLCHNCSSAAERPMVLLDFQSSDDNTVNDSSSSGVSHIIQQGVVTNCGATKALVFDGYSTHFELQKTYLLNFERGATITAWLAPARMSSNTIVIGRPNQNIAWTTPTLGLYFPSENRIGMGLWTPEKCIVEAQRDLRKNEWIFAVCVWDRSTARIYINGELQGEKSCSGKLPNFQVPFAVGCGNRNNPFYQGLLGESRIYDRVLDSAEITRLFKTQRSLYPQHTGIEQEHGFTVKSRRNGQREWREYPTKTLNSLRDFTPNAASVELNQYGGWKERTSSASGFFRTEKINNRWWLIDPMGCYFIHVGVGAVNIGNSPAALRNYKEQYGTREKWAADTSNLLYTNGFNGIGNWSEIDVLRNAGAPPLAYTIRGGFLSGFAKTKGLIRQGTGHSNYAADVPPIFVPGFEEFCEAEAASFSKYNNDPYLLGIFSDNEIIPADLTAFLAVDRIDPLLKPSYDAAFEWLSKKRGTSEFAISSITRMENMEFGAYAFEHYYRIVSTAIKKHLPNHLYLGSRLHGATYRNPLIIKACGRYADVVSINYYSSWVPEDINFWEKISGKPLMITEFYTKGEDSGLPNRTGAGWLVPTQADRGWFYQNFILELLESQACVGWHWFKYMDNDPDNKKAEASNIDSNKGIVTINFKPYETLLNTMRAVNREVYPLTEYFDSRD